MQSWVNSEFFENMHHYANSSSNDLSVNISHNFHMSSEKLAREIAENIMVSEDLLERKGLPSSFGWLAHFCTK